MTAEIRICTVRDTSETSQKTITSETKLYFKESVFLFRYGLCKFKNAGPTLSTISNQSVVVSFFKHLRNSHKKISEVIK